MATDPRINERAMERRRLLVLFSAVAATWPRAGAAQQQAGQMPRIANLSTGSAVPLLQDAF